MPNQLCFLNSETFPQNYADIEAIYQQYIKESADDADSFTWSNLRDKGRSYFFYGKKVFEFYPGEGQKARLKISGVIAAFVFGKDPFIAEKFYPYRYADFSSESYNRLIAGLQKTKKDIFRNTITEKFACCNSFVECSDQKACLYPNDRFYNGCEYRKNLEAGRIFYGKNKNI